MFSHFIILLTGIFLISPIYAAKDYEELSLAETIELSITILLFVFTHGIEMCIFLCVFAFITILLGVAPPEPRPRDALWIGRVNTAYLAFNYYN